VSCPAPEATDAGVLWVPQGREWGSTGDSRRKYERG